MMIDHPRLSQVPQLKELWKAAFRDPEDFIDLFFREGFGLQRCLCALDGGTVAGMLYWLDCHVGEAKYAYLYGIAVREDRRGRGICRSLVTAAHMLLARDGYAGTLLYPQEEGLRKMYRKLGYENGAFYCESVSSAGNIQAEIHSITAAEYSRLRREWITAGSVIQEGAFLPLLEAEFRFYRGTDFIMAARPEREFLYGAELLGSPLAAPGILAALGYPFGVFRSPGAKVPGAMFRPLKEGTEAPDYMGFLLD